MLLTTFPHTISIDQINEPWTLLKQPYLASNRIKRISHIIITKQIFFQTIHVISSDQIISPVVMSKLWYVDEYCNTSIENSDVRYYELIIQLYVAYQSIWFIKQKSNQRAIHNQPIHLLVQSFHPDWELMSNYPFIASNIWGWLWYCGASNQTWIRSKRFTSSSQITTRMVLFDLDIKRSTVGVKQLMSSGLDSC